MQSGVLVQVRWISERTMADPTFEWLEAGVRPEVDFETVLARVELATVDAAETNILVLITVGKE